MNANEFWEAVGSLRAYRLGIAPLTAEEAQKAFLSLPGMASLSPTEIDAIITSLSPAEIDAIILPLTAAIKGKQVPSPDDDDNSSPGKPQPGCPPLPLTRSQGLTTNVEGGPSLRLFPSEAPAPAVSEPVRGGAPFVEEASDDES